MTARLDILHTARDGVFSRDVRSGKRELTIYHLQAPIYREIDANQPNSTLTPSTKAELQDFKTSRLQDFPTSRLQDFNAPFSLARISSIVCLGRITRARSPSTSISTGSGREL